MQIKSNDLQPDCNEDLIFNIVPQIRNILPKIRFLIYIPYDF